LSREDFVAPCIPPFVELTAVRLDIRRWRLMRSMTRTRRKPQEERFSRVRGARVVDKEDCLVGHVVCEVVTLFRRRRWVDLVIVVDEVGVILVGLATEKAVVALEPATKRPAPPTRTHLVFIGRSQMPLADTERAVAVAHENLRQHSVFVRHLGVITGEPRRHVGDTRHAHAVMVAASQQRRTRR
jgi:hypothetical protein